MTVLKLCARRPIIVRVEGPLRVPVSEPCVEVRALVRRGERAIVVDLAEVSRIDAAGVEQPDQGVQYGGCRRRRAANRQRERVGPADPGPDRTLRPAERRGASRAAQRADANRTVFDPTRSGGLSPLSRPLAGGEPHGSRTSAISRLCGLRSRPMDGGFSSAAERKRGTHS